MALHAIAGTTVRGPVCGQSGDVCCIGINAFRRKQQEYRYRSILCAKCKAWARRHAEGLPIAPAGGKESE